MRLVRLGKRGMEDKISFVIWEIIVILMVVIALTVSVRGIANNNTYWKKYHSTDLALMTDLMLTNQGDFSVNYDIKDLEKNYITKLALLKEMRFQIILKEGSYFVYDGSSKEDRFPQSYIFAKDRDVKIIQSNITTDYIQLYKEGNIFGIRTQALSPSISCPSTDTKGVVGEKHFEIIRIPSTDTLPSVAKEISREEYITGVFNGIEKQTEEHVKELLIAFKENNGDSIRIYYDSTVADNQERSKKMACLLAKQVSYKYPDKDIKSMPYDNSMELSTFIGKRAEYQFWIALDMPTQDKISNNDLTSAMQLALEEFYR